MIYVTKRDGKREEFNREKLKQSIEIACRKRPISGEEIEEMVNRIIREMFEIEGNEVKSVWLGEKVMKELKAIDHVAYIRFASVYRNFKDIDEFMKEFETIKRKESEKNES